VSRIYFNNITALSENGCFVGGDVPGKVKDVYFNNVRVKLASSDSFVMDKRPCKGEGFIKVSAEKLLKAKVPVITENAEITID
jgi:hypothetical protein